LEEKTVPILEEPTKVTPYEYEFFSVNANKALPTLITVWMENKEPIVATDFNLGIPFDDCFGPVAD